MGHNHSHEHDPQLRMGEVPAEVLARIRERSSLLKHGFSRRDAVRLMGMAGIAGLAGCGASGMTNSSSSSANSTGTSTSSGSSSSACSKGISKTEGPYWVDGDTNTPNRSDIRPDTKGTVVQTGYQGVLLNLSFAIYTYSASGCTSLQNARVDIWHASAQGVYSDISSENTSDDNFLRGYQLSDASGLVSFTTIYPGWYSGRTPHIHLRVRTYDSSGNLATNSTTQIFFNDSLSDSIYAASSYYARSGSRDTYNSGDNIYNGDTQLLLSLTGSVSSGYTGSLYGIGLPFTS